MRKSLFLLAASLLSLAACAQTLRREPRAAGPEAGGSATVPTVIFETDMGNDVDDALALDMLYNYADLGTINLLAVMTNKDNRYSAEYIDILNTCYQRPRLPIGIVRNGADSGGDDNYAAAVCLMNDRKGRPLFPRSVDDVRALPDAHRLYRQLLAGEPDQSVVIISTGFSTNLARLLATPADDVSDLSGSELVARKVRLLVTMAGGFDGSNNAEYNVVIDIPSAQKVFHEWPTPIVTSPFEVGAAIPYPATAIEAWAQRLTTRKKAAEAERHSPVVEGYKAYLPMPYDRAAWDLTAVLYAVEGRDWFNLSPRGTIVVTDSGQTLFHEDPHGAHRYLITTPAQNHRILRHLISLTSAGL